MTVKLVTAHPLEFNSLQGGCTGLSESTIVKMPHCWKSHAFCVITGGLLSHRMLGIFYDFFPDLC